MKSRKSKIISSNPPGLSGEQLNPRSNAFNFIKNRLFQSNNTNGLQKSADGNERNPPTLVDEESKYIVKPTSKSFDELPIPSIPNQKIKAQRPISMMAMETLLARSNNLMPISRRNKATDKAEKRASLIVVREGYLFKKTDFRPFQKQSKLDKGWKLYKVILRGHKLYLFKVHAESPLRSLFPSSPSLSISSSIDNNLSATSLKLVSSEFDQEAQQTLFPNSTNSAYGLMFMELHQVNMQPKRQTHLVLDANYLYICYRADRKQLWRIEQKVSIPQLKIIQINSTIESIDSPTSPSSTSSQKSDPFLNSYAGAISFNISFITKPSVLGVFATQYRHAGLSWIQAFQNVHQKRPLCIEEDLFGSISSLDCHDSTQPSVASTATTMVDLESSIDSKMYDSTQRYHPDLLRKCRSDDSNSIDIIGGTVIALVHELLLTEDMEYIQIFLLTYSTFTTGSSVLNEIKSFVLDSSSARLDTQIINLFTIWCKEFGLDVMGDVASGMMSVLESISAVNTTAVKDLVLNTVTENAAFAAGDEIVCQNETQGLIEKDQTTQIKASQATDEEYVALSSLVTNQLTPQLFLRISPESFADQVYLFHFSQHVKYRQTLLNPLSYLPRPQTSAEMLNSLLFTSSSPHFLTKLVRNHVLIDSQQQQGGVILRSQLLTHWISVGMRLFELGDISGWCAVAMGLCSAGVVRLKEAWKLVDRAMVHTVQTQWARILTDHGLFDQSIWSEMWDKSKQFAKVLDLNSPSLPFFGTIRQTVDRQRKHPSKFLGPKVISFEECKQFYNIIRASLDRWKQEPKRDKANPNIQAIRPLQLFFEYSVTDLASVPHNLKYLQESSLACEPKIFGQVHESHKLNSNELMADVQPPSNSSLHFPTILESCVLFENGLGFIPESKGTPIENAFGLNDSIRANAQDLEGNMSYSSRSTDRKGFRRRTFNFASDLTMKSTDSRNSKTDVLESINSRSWFGSISSGLQHSIGSSKVHAESNSCAVQLNHGELDLVVAQGDLVFKASAMLKGSDKDCSSMKRTESLHSVHFLKQGKRKNRIHANRVNIVKVEEDTEEDHGSPDQIELLINVKGAYFDHLVECLISNISFYQDNLKEQWHSLAEEHQQPIDRVIMDEENFINIFFIAYRSYHSSKHLLNMLHKKYLAAKTKCKLTVKRKNPTLKLVETYFSSPVNEIDQADIEINTYDWKQIASIHLRILNLILFWVEEYPYDFIDEPEFVERTHTFLGDARENLHDWKRLVECYLEKNKEDQGDKQKNLVDAINMASKIQENIDKLECQFIQNSLSPCYDMKSANFDTECLYVVQDLYHRLMNGSQIYTATLQSTHKRTSLSISHEPLEQDVKSLLDDYPPEYILDQVDKDVRQLLGYISIQDWAQTFDVMEAQCGDLYAWLPARKPSRTSKISTAFIAVMDVPFSHTSDYHVLPEEVVISDIFNAIQGARRSIVSPLAFSDDDLLLAFPGSIQHLYCMHFIIRSWAINQIASTKIDHNTRTARIHKFLQIILLSKARNEKMNLFPELKGSETTRKRVPGFVENAIASALVSPEVRLFSKAWNDIVFKHGLAELDSLESLLNKMQSSFPITRSSSFASSASQDEQLLAVVPSLAWILERIVEICFAVPDAVDKKENWVNFEKKKYLYHFLELVINVQADINEQEKQYTKDEQPGLSFLISPNPTKMNWEGLKEYAHRENKRSQLQSTSNSISLLGSANRSQGSKSIIFNKLVTKQMEKLKRDFKERDRVDKDWLTLQYKLQKKQMEQARSSEKQDRSQSVMPRINSFFKGLRPVSMVASPIHQAFPTNNSDDHLAATKASTVINLIHSTTSIASTCTKRDFVFRIVTEEGGQYLFQGMDRQDMDDWMHQINGAAREGAVKRQSVLAAESLDNECERRKSVILTETPSRNQPVSHRKSVYGVSLDTLMRDRKVPLVVEKCIQEIEKRGLEEVGIYRVAGTGSIVTALKNEFNKEISKVDLSDPKWADINVIADAFKQFLRELPEPLLTYTYYDEFINASASGDHDQRVYLIKEVIKKLPYSNYTLLKRIIEHFVTVTDFEAINHMYATNLAIVFGPTLLQPAPGPASFATTMSNLGYHQNIVKYLVLNYHYLFDIESEEVETKGEQRLE